MIIRYPNTRGHLKNNWIESRRTFSNNSYWNPNYMNFGSIRVINDDVLQPGQMVPNHEHINYDILGYLVEGTLEHRDSLGNVINASYGQIQHMWCGKSIWHSEKCISDIPARYLQIWITPQKEFFNTDPFYEVISKPNQFLPLNIEIKQNITIQAGVLNELKELDIQNKGYLYIVSGSVVIDDIELTEGFGVELHSEKISGNFQAHIILIEEY